MFERTKAAKEQLDNYKNAFFFLLFAALYCAVLYLQADASGSFDVAMGHQALIPDVSTPGPSLGPMGSGTPAVWRGF